MSCRYPKTVCSQSGKYSLTIDSTPTKPGCWDYTRGTVRHTSSSEEIITVKRNYSSFPHLFIEDHPVTHHDYLICGEDYQGQTVIDLTTGDKKSALSEGAEDGFGFCWVQYSFDTNSQILIVSGCIWAGPYETRFYDFSDPLSGWTELEVVGEAIYDDCRSPTIEGDTIKCYSTSVPDDDEHDDIPVEDRTIRSITTLKRVGMKLSVVDEWVSDDEKERRQKHDESVRLYEEWYTNFKSSDPLYLRHIERLKDPVFISEDYNSIGQTHNDWCPTFSLTEKRICRRIMKEGPIKIKLEWAVSTGPVKLIVQRDNEKEVATFFEHSVTGIDQAYDLAVGELKTRVTT